MNSVVNKMDTQVSGLLKNTYVNWALRIILVLYAAFAHVPEGSMLQSLAENIVFRLAVAVLIVYLSFNDPTLAILLSICFVVTIQGVNKNKVTELTKMSEKFYGESPEDEEVEVDVEEFKDEKKECKDYGEDNCEVNNCSWDDEKCHPKKKMDPTESEETFYGGNQMMKDMGDVEGDEDDVEEEENSGASNPEAFTNFQMGAPLDNSNNSFTSNRQFNDVQNDKVPGSDESSIQTFKKQHSAQGTGNPSGINPSSSEYATF